MITTNNINNFVNPMNTLSSRQLAEMAQHSTDMKRLRDRFFDVYETRLNECTNDAQVAKLRAVYHDCDLTGFNPAPIIQATEAMRVLNLNLDA